MEKVILLSASPRKDSNCELVLNECRKVIESEGLEAKILTLKGKHIRACVACNMCVDLKRCVYNDDGVNEIIEELKSAKGFIVATPVYFGAARGDLMCALQRIGYVSRRLENNILSWMVGGPIAVGRRGGLTTTYSELLMFYLMNDMIVPGSTYWNIVFGVKQGDVLNDIEGIETVKRFSANVSQVIKKIL